MPKPPAASSPLMTTRSSFQSVISRGSRSVTIARPLRPTTSPTNKTRISARPRDNRSDRLSRGRALMRVLFVGDVVGRSGRAIVTERLPRLITDWKLDLVVINGEDAAGGFGITEAIYQEL